MAKSKRLSSKCGLDGSCLMTVTLPSALLLTGILPPVPQTILKMFWEMKSTSGSVRSLKFISDKFFSLLAAISSEVTVRGNCIVLYAHAQLSVATREQLLLIRKLIFLLEPGGMLRWDDRALQHNRNFHHCSGSMCGTAKSSLYRPAGHLASMIFSQLLWYDTPQSSHKTQFALQLSLQKPQGHGTDFIAFPFITSYTGETRKK